MLCLKCVRLNTTTRNASCSTTHSTLRVFSDEFAPPEITRLLEIEPTSSFRKGDSHALGKLQRKANGWFYCTENISSSKDTRRHVDLILARLDGKLVLLKELLRQGCEIDISSYWVSAEGQGGPCLEPEQMLKLGTLGIGIWWDIYFTGENES